MLETLRQALSHWPPQGLCLLCHQPADGRPLLCQHCEADLPRLNNPCPTCGHPLPEPAEGVCGRCLRHPPAWDRLAVLGDYAFPYPALIQRLKYQGEYLMASLLGELMARHLPHEPLPEVLLPVPLHWWRRWRRGFNQAEALCRTIRRHTGLPLDPHLLRRVRTTRPQARLSQAERRRNLKGAFALGPHHYRHVALVDDVVTTGTTATLLCRLLRHSGVERIEVWAVSRALIHPKQDYPARR
ncbi:ComF family protein [Pseudaeromonas sp. ZJS20]|uniref:ComF family protein n=1 Tax=Pseudaeromonas aegiceratis TaxID=3153928 RepID=UPI00390C69B2